MSNTKSSEKKVVFVYIGVRVSFSGKAQEAFIIKGDRKKEIMFMRKRSKTKIYIGDMFEGIMSDKEMTVFTSKKLDDTYPDGKYISDCATRQTAALEQLKRARDRARIENEVIPREIISELRRVTKCLNHFELRYFMDRITIELMTKEKE